MNIHGLKKQKQEASKRRSAMMDHPRNNQEHIEKLTNKIRRLSLEIKHKRSLKPKNAK
jgi:hypothetical protein